MDDVYVVLTGKEVDGVYKSMSGANGRISELCRFSFEDVLYDMEGLAYCETSHVVKCSVI